MQRWIIRKFISRLRVDDGTATASVVAMASLRDQLRMCHSAHQKAAHLKYLTKLRVSSRPSTSPQLLERRDLTEMSLFGDDAVTCRTAMWRFAPRLVVHVVDGRAPQLVRKRRRHLNWRSSQDSSSSSSSSSSASTSSSSTSTRTSEPADAATEDLGRWLKRLDATLQTRTTDDGGQRHRFVGTLTRGQLRRGYVLDSIRQTGAVVFTATYMEREPHREPCLFDDVMRRQTERHVSDVNLDCPRTVGLAVLRVDYPVTKVARLTVLCASDRVDEAVGSALLAAVEEYARVNHDQRWLMLGVTTESNAWYAERGYVDVGDMQRYKRLLPADGDAHDPLDVDKLMGELTLSDDDVLPATCTPTRAATAEAAAAPPTRSGGRRRAHPSPSPTPSGTAPGRRRPRRLMRREGTPAPKRRPPASAGRGERSLRR